MKSHYPILLAAIVLTATITVANVANPLAITTADESESTSSADEIDQTVKENIKSILKQVPVKGVTDAKAASHKKAIIGEVQRITDAAITIKNLDRQQIIPLENALLLKNNNMIEVEDIAVGNWATVMGSQQGDEIAPDFILISASSLRSDPQVVYVGTITELTRTSLTITSRGGEGEKELTVSRTTDLEDPEGNPAVLSDFEEDMTVLATGIETDDEVEANTIRSLAPLDVVGETP